MDATIVELLNRKAANTPRTAAYCRRQGFGHWTPVSWKDHVDEARRFARLFVAEGVVPGDRVAIVGRTSPEWQLADWATLLAGGVVVGIDPELPPERLSALLTRLSPRVICALGEGAAAVDQARLDNGAVRLRLDPGENVGKRWRKWDGLSDSSVALPLVGLDDLATLILTSGTTGEPKAIPYTHRQLSVACQAIMAAFPQVAPGDPVLCWLPLSYLFQRMMNLVAACEGGVVHFVDRPTEVVDCIREVNPTIFCGVPRFFEKLAAAMESEAANRTGIVARSMRRILDGSSDNPSWPSRAIDHFVKRRMQRILGRRMKYLVTGGAALPTDVARKLSQVGWDVLEAYGISENAVPMSANRPGVSRLGSVGSPLSENEIKLARDGEVLVRGAGVATGYWPDGDLPTTADGYLCSGDLGRFDDDGFLYLLGRKSEFIKTSTGRKVNPAAVAEVYQRHPLLEAVVVFGDNVPRLVGLVVVDQRELKRRLGQVQTAAASSATDQVSRLVRRALDEMASVLATHERIASFRVPVRPFTVATGELTPSLKIRRPVVAEHYAEDIAAMYEEIAGASVQASLAHETATA